jgi:hypothetical protein
MTHKARGYGARSGRRLWERAAGAALALAGAALPTVAAGRPAAAVAAPAGTRPQAGARPPALPAHLFAPYFETYAGDNPAAVASASGARYLTLAFVQTAYRGSCTPDWDGEASTPVAPSVFGAAIAHIRARGGDVVVSFGGYAADSTGTDIAESCTDVAKIAEAYEDVIRTYGVTRIDLDVEDLALANWPSVQRRDRAVRMVEQWAARNGRHAQFVLTVPGPLAGPGPDVARMLADAKAAGATISVVNTMAFDFGTRGRQQMALDAEEAAHNLYRYLARLHPGTRPARLWPMVGLTVMIGADDSGRDQDFTLADARDVAAWGRRRGLGELSFWALQRDNGGCPGAKATDNCSGLAQADWAFTRALASFG